MTNATDGASAQGTLAKSNGISEFPDHIAGRRLMLRALFEELVGPSPKGPDIDLEAIVKGSLPSEFNIDGPFVQKGSDEEILCVEPPGLRYGVGILYPWGAMQKADGADESAADPDVETTQSMLAQNERKTTPQPLTRHGEKSLKRVLDRAGNQADSEDGEDFDLSSANKRRPNSMAVSFLVQIPTGAQMVVRASGGRYASMEVKTANGRRRTWWARRSVVLEARFATSQLLQKVGSVVYPKDVQARGAGLLAIRVEAYSRPTQNPAQRLITVCLINRTTEGRGNNHRSLFQAEFNVAFEQEDTCECVLPYPSSELTSPDAEERALDLLYRDVQTYAIGHGCAANWSKSEKSKSASRIFAEALPTFEMPSITPDIRRADGSNLEVPMAPLAGLLPDDDGRQAIQELTELYAAWIDEKTSEASMLHERFKDAAERHLDLCRRCLDRIHGGVALLDSDPIAARAFRLANEAILIQQLRSTRRARSVKIVDGNVIFDRPLEEIDLLARDTDRGKWRAFQIAFLLMSLRSAIEGDHPDRETIDLIWFPTGGGKTEAYLGLAAFSAFHRRLVDSNDAGVHILMRYTLRLLTAQQFQRASGLICAMEHIRLRESDSFGSQPFSIGIWLGGDTTPNSRQDARNVLRLLHKGDRYVANKLLLTKCPWCSAQIGPLEFKKEAT